MVRIIFGILLCFWGLIMILGWIFSAKPLDTVGAFVILVFLIPGVLLVYYGSRARRRKRQIKSTLVHEKENLTEKGSLSPDTTTIVSEKDVSILQLEKIIENPKLLESANFSMRYDGIKALKADDTPESKEILQKFQSNYLGIERLFNVPEHSPVLALCIDRNLYAIPSKYGNKINIFDLNSNEIKYTLRGPGGSISSMSFSPNGLFLGVGCYVQGHAEYITIYDFNKSNTPIKKFHESTGIAGVFAPAIFTPTWGTRHAVFSPDSKSIAIGTENGDVSILELKEQSPRKLSSAGHILPHDLCFSHDGNLIAQFTYGGGRATSSHEKYLMKVWEVSSGNEKLSYESGPFSIHHKTRAGISFSTDDKFLAAGGHEQDKTIKIWDISTGKLISSFEAHQHAITSLIFSKDNTYLLSGSNDGTIKLWSILDSQDNLKSEPMLIDHIQLKWEIAGKITIGQSLEAGKPQEIEKLIHSKKENEMIAVFACGLNKSGDPDNTCLLFLTIPHHLKK